MNTKVLYDSVCIKASRTATRSYSTSFSLGIRFLSKRFRDPIYAIYGFVRFADEIVDTFHEYDRKSLLDKFWKETHEAIEQKISLNPILNSFQCVVNKYNIPMDLIDTFMRSMEMDLGKKTYEREEYDQYILGSAEVVGLMCLCVFCEGDKVLYDKLRVKAMKLGAAFQKINFLRDLGNDSNDLGRFYFPNTDMTRFDAKAKAEIEREIEADFREGYEGILLLPKHARFGVYLAYVYYKNLLRKIRKYSPEQVMKERIRVPNGKKLSLLLSSYIRHGFNAL